MNKIKVFKTNNKKINHVEYEINEWVEKEGITIHQISTIQGSSYVNSSVGGFSSNEIEILVFVLYSKT